MHKYTGGVATIKKLILLLCLALLISACSPIESSLSTEPNEPSTSESTVLEEPEVYIPPHDLTMEETIEQFFEQQYNSYIALEYTDISSLLDMQQTRDGNPLIWLQNLIQRRRLIAENELAYVEDTKFPYTINYQEDVSDERMEFWQDRGIHDDDETLIHFTITGEEGKAYPPFLALNGQHSMRLKEVEQGWKITFHYYPGSSRFRQDTPLKLVSEEQMLKSLMAEFNNPETSGASSEVLVEDTVPASAVVFNPAKTVQYAVSYTETPNPIFYHVDDWMGNCANFTSQSIWYGFATNSEPKMANRENMTSQWFAGQGGGSAAWENVESFWNYVTAAKGAQQRGLHGEVMQSIHQLDEGGLIQTRSARFRNTQEGYSHNLLLVDSSTLKLAQNSPDCFVYYSDLVNVDTRFFNPSYLVK